MPLAYALVILRGGMLPASPCTKRCMVPYGLHSGASMLPVWPDACLLFPNSAVGSTFDSRWPPPLRSRAQIRDKGATWQESRHDKLPSLVLLNCAGDRAPLFWCSCLKPIFPVYRNGAYGGVLASIRSPAGSDCSATIQQDEFLALQRSLDE